MTLRSIMGAGLVLMLAGSVGAATSSFAIPFDANVTLTPAGGTGTAVTTFGLGTSIANLTPLFYNLPASRPAGVSIGFYPAGSTLDVYMETTFNGTDFAFSNNTIDAPSRTAFMDLNNSLGLSGSVYQKIDNTTYLVHLDDARSYLFDDDDDDLLMRITVTPVPEPASLMVLGIGSGLLTLRRRGIRW